MSNRGFALTAGALGLALLPLAWGLWPAARMADAQAPTFRMRIQTSVPSAATQFEGMQKFAERVQKMSAGRLKIDVLPIGAVVGLSEILEAVDKNVVDKSGAWFSFQGERLGQGRDNARQFLKDNHEHRGRVELALREVMGLALPTAPVGAAAVSENGHAKKR